MLPPLYLFLLFNPLALSPPLLPRAPLNVHSWIILLFSFSSNTPTALICGPRTILANLRKDNHPPRLDIAYRFLANLTRMLVGAVMVPPRQLAVEVTFKAYSAGTCDPKFGDFEKINRVLLQLSRSKVYVGTLFAGAFECA